MADLAVDQHEDGTIPPNVPWADLDPNIPPLGAETGWDDAATVVPWTLYERYGDSGILRTQWASMVRWADAFAARAWADLDFSSGGFSFGDWLDSSAADDETNNAGLAERAAGHFRSEYFTETGRAAYPAQKAYALAIAFDLLLPSQKGVPGICWQNRLPSTDSTSAADSWARRWSATHWRIPATATRPGDCCFSVNVLRGSIRRPWARPLSGNAGTRCFLMAA